LKHHLFIVRPDAAQVVDDRHPQEQGLKLDCSAGESSRESLVDDRHPQEQGLKPSWCATPTGRGSTVDDRHPQEQGLKPARRALASVD